MYWQRVAAHVSIMYLRMGEIMVEDWNGLLEISNQFIWEQIIKSSDRIYDFHINQVTKYRKQILCLKLLNEYDSI